MPNHWQAAGDLVIEDRTVFRQVGWLGFTGAWYPLGTSLADIHEPGGYSPVYIEIGD